MKRIIDAKIWKTGNSYVITVPINLVEKFKLKVGSFIEVSLKNEDK